MAEREPEPLLLTGRVAPGQVARGDAAATPLRLELSADERTRLRGHRRSSCGRDLLLQLPRGAALEPGEWLAGPDGTPRVQVEAAAEPLLLVSSDHPLALLRAAYHLGNRHVALQVGEGGLRLLDDPVLADLLRQLAGLQLERRLEPFLPEAGAYGGAHDHTHAAGIAAPQP
ncbi:MULTISPECIES: urease accessory protein UreE [unclassified Cyanobium]|uniref:urease accessory protein UreE n=1 Tax=unclassified Cyanobium TaxID=2627006 RepID=UPI0020CB7080|nr:MULTISPECIES: urease accessory protein UreE [unclassified Cyanobium]MCP9859192.1 urease accessory protein UreE [Cyanobium sp. Cruz-8H5]MCP9866415.1 urease accessory protein UreE [Cyanobium sp. Cruz-8D1]